MIGQAIGALQACLEALEGNANTLSLAVEGRAAAVARIDCSVNLHAQQL